MRPLFRISNGFLGLTLNEEQGIRAKLYSEWQTRFACKLEYGLPTGCQKRYMPGHGLFRTSAIRLGLPRYG